MKNPTFFLIASAAAVVTFASYAHAATLPQGCGVNSADFKVKTVRHESLPSSADSGKARIIFVQKLDGDFSADPTTRFAIDGNWVGADKGDSYFAANIEPGKHKLCAGRQGRTDEDKANVAAGTLSVEPGKTYYVQFTITRSEIGTLDAHSAGQLLGYATPDMTVKRKDTVDTAALSGLPGNKGEAQISRLPVSTVTPK
jgi:hypothetical protein